ncbi:UNKNOWN [Stylonychia lemnae]|uniref:AIG1-type G domain-containing protein n=1 Tax=Stylonychia lemnae TaxID=5949 RepID=A0A078B804_STYLE|nr:UNKNOWN [Stylonychia lemnae]|eukprot:CDW90351.1 UNKNOWN [Stylonychia lemnae]
MQFRKRFPSQMSEKNLKKNHRSYLSDYDNQFSSQQEIEKEQPQSQDRSDYQEKQRQKASNKYNLLAGLRQYFSISLTYVLIVIFLIMLTDGIRGMIQTQKQQTKESITPNLALQPKEYSFVLLGSEKSGKSSFGNLLLGFELFDVSKSQHSQLQAALKLNGTLFGEVNGPLIQIIDSQGHENKNQKDFENASKLIYLLKQNPVQTTFIYVIELQNLISKNPLNEYRLNFYRSAFKDFLNNTIFVVSKWSFNENQRNERSKENVDHSFVIRILQKLLKVVGFENPRPTVYYIDSYYEPDDFMQDLKFNQNFQNFWEDVSNRKATNILNDHHTVKNSLQKYKVTHKRYQDNEKRLKEMYEEMMRKYEEKLKRDKKCDESYMCRIYRYIGWDYEMPKTLKLETGITQ